MADYFVHEDARVDQGATLGEGTKVWHFSHVCSSAVIGKNCSFGQNVYVAPNVRIGNNVKVQNNVSIYEGVELEDDVFCGPSMVFTNVRTPRSAFPRNTSDDYQKTVVGRGSSIGANATIVCGVRLGVSTLIGAGAVVTKDVPDFAVMLGVPAKRKAWACHCGILLSKEEGTAWACEDCGRKYHEETSELLVESK